MLVLISVSERAAVPDESRNDDRGGGAWVPSHHHGWHNPDYSVNNGHDYSSRRLSTKSAERSCFVHTVKTEPGQTSDWLFLEVNSDQVMVAIVLQDNDTNNQQQHWIVTQQQQYAIPGSTLTTPLHSRIRQEEAPFAAAQRVAWTALELPNDELVTTPIPIVMDQYNLADGSIPEEQTTMMLKSHNMLEWTFLGRYRNLADAGGGFTFTYLLKAPAAASKKFPKLLSDPATDQQEQLRNLHTFNSNGGTAAEAGSLLFSMSTEEAQKALLRGEFAEIKGAATMGLALQHTMANR